MKLILIYGPPASGKLTIAKELIKLTDYKLLHNHAVIDICTSILDKEKRNFWPLVRKIRYDIIKEALRQKIPGMILTLAYTKEGEEFIKNVIKLVEKNKNSKVYLVKLNTDISDLKKRVIHPSRKKHGKLTDTKGLENWIAKNGNPYYGKKKNIIINTSKTRPKESAKKIIKLIN